MKLRVRQTGVVEKELEVNIRNPSATLANVRAAIAILFKLDPHSFRMVPAAAASSSTDTASTASNAAPHLENDTTRLSASGLKEGDVVLLVAKRPREEDGVNEGRETAVPAAATSSSAPPAVVPIVPPSQPPVVASPAAAAVDTLNTLAPSSSSAASGNRPTVPQRRIRRQTATRATAPHTLAESEEDAFLAARMLADGEEALGDEEDDDEEDDEEEDEEEEEGGVQEMVSQLLSVPNLIEMRQEFLANPQAVLANIQATNPRLFQLIAAHNEQFLDMVQNEALLEALQDERDVEAFLGEEDEEDYDEEEEAAMHQIILDALGAAAAEGEGSTARMAGSSAATSATLGRNATQMLDSLRSTTTGTATARGTAESGGAGEAGADRPSSSSNTFRVPVVISDEDQKKIDDLMQLGFTKEQCTAAFFKCGRSVERAANLLFDQPPQL